MNLEEVKKLITRYTNGTATPKERNQLENWYAQRQISISFPMMISKFDKVMCLVSMAVVCLIFG